MRAPQLTLVAMLTVLPVCAATPAWAQMNENCTVSVLNRNVRVNPDGSWVLPNIPANFGMVRARVTCVVNGQTISGESEPFLVPANGVVNLPHIRFGQSTPIPVSVTIGAATRTLTQIGGTVQLTVTALYTDTSTQDVTGAATGTGYTISNTDIATITADGLVTAVKTGTVVIQATHEGASGMISIQVVLAGTDTDGDGIPDDFELANGLKPNDPVDAQEDFDRDGLTNLQEFQLGTTLRKADSDEDGLLDGDEVVRGTSPLLKDTDGDGVSDGLEVQTGSDPLNPASVNLGAALSSIAVTPGNFTLTFNTIAGDVSTQLTVTGTLKDGGTLNLTTRGVNFASSNLAICSFSAVPGRVFAGQSGSCVITATIGSFSATSNGTVSTFAPTPLGFVDLPGPGNGVDVAGGFAFVATGNSGLTVVETGTEPNTQRRVVTTLSLLGTANDVKLAGSFAYVAAGAAGLHVIDVSNPALPRLMGSVDTPGSAADVRIRGNLAFVADGSAGLQIVDVTQPTAPRIIGSIGTVAPANGVDITEALAVVAIGPSGLQIINVSNPAAPTQVGLVDTPGDAQDVIVRESIAYVADHTGSLRVVDFTNPGAPVLGIATPGATGGFPQDVAISDSFVAGADVFFVNGVPIFDISTPSTPIPRVILGFQQFRDDDGASIAMDGSHVYLGTFQGRLYIGQYRIRQDLNGIPPTVTINSPVNGATFVEGETIPISVTATDDVAVARVSLLMNGSAIATDTTAPYQFNVVAPSGATSLTFSAEVQDLGNNVRTSPNVQVTIIPDPLTTAAGRVVRMTGELVPGATVSCRGVTGVTGADGSFLIANIPTTQPTVVCLASFVTDTGTTLRGISAQVQAIRAATTAVGDIVIAPVPVITSIAPNAIDATRPPASVQVTGVNLAGASFSFAPVLSPAPITAGSAQINAAGTLATVPIAVAPTARGRFTLVGTNSFGPGETTPTAGNTVTVFNALDDGDTDGDGFPDGLELIYGSDASNPESVPDFNSRGDIVSAAVSVSNTAFPATTQTLVSPAVSVMNQLLESTSPQVLVSPAVSVANTLLPQASSQTLVSNAFSLSNVAFASSGPQTLVSGAFSVSNLGLSSGLQHALSSAFSLQNLDPAAPGTTQALQAAQARQEPLRVTLLAPRSGTTLVEGQTMTVRADVTRVFDPATVVFSVNGRAFETDTSSPYELTFTVPAGQRTLVFGASARSLSGQRAEAPAVSVSVDPDPLTTITGRVVDAAGNPVADAWVDVLSPGMQAEFFKFNQQLMAVPDLTSEKAIHVGRVTAINMRNPLGVFGNDPFGVQLFPDYAARFSGWISIADAGTYTFFLRTHEGARLKVGDVTVIDLSTSTGVSQQGAGAIALTPGLVPIEITYFESRGDAEIQLSMARPGGEREVVAPVMLVPGWQPFVVKTDASGRFSISGVPTALSTLQVRATVADGSQTTTATSGVVSPVTANSVNVGDIVIRRGPR
jgi:hypothetical protein